MKGVAFLPLGCFSERVYQRYTYEMDHARTSFSFFLRPRHNTGMDENPFEAACRNGDVARLEEVARTGAVPPSRALIFACKHGHLHVAKWLRTVWAQDVVSAFVVRMSLRFACIRGHLHIVQWLIQSFGLDIHADEENAFRSACVSGDEATVRWLFDRGGVDIHACNHHAFRLACGYGCFRVAQWLVSLGGVDIHACTDEAFRLASEKGRLATVQWLFAQGGVDIHAEGDVCFRTACRKGHLHLARWLLALDPEYVWPKDGVHVLQSWSAGRGAWLWAVVCANHVHGR